MERFGKVISLALERRARAKEPKKGQEKEYSLWLVEKELLGARGVKVESPLGDPWLPEVFLIYEPLEGS